MAKQSSSFPFEGKNLTVTGELMTVVTTGGKPLFLQSYLLKFGETLNENKRLKLK